MQPSLSKMGGRSPAVLVHMLVGIYGHVEATMSLWKGEGGLALGAAAVTDVHHSTGTVRMQMWSLGSV